MGKNLVIVESPAKAKTIEKFLGKDFVVESSFGHIRDLVSKDMGVQVENQFTPIYEVPSEKKDVVSKLKKLVKSSDQVWLASDEDREGEAIAWHLAETLGLDVATTHRIVFHEITKPAILKAVENPRRVNQNLVDAQQARRVLDRLVGFELSPVLWKKIKPGLSAGRVQSVAVRLIVEREREIQNFTSKATYRVVGTFVKENGKKFNAELNHRFESKEEALAFLEKCKTTDFSVNNVDKRPGTRNPAAPFTTSTLQQEASRKLGFSVSQTMSLAQRLYEAGLITYMRTDSVNLSGLAINTAKDEIISQYGENYSKVRNFSTKNKGAQEAHEAIRPTYMDRHEAGADRNQQRLYDLIWKRTIASQMAQAKLEHTTATITGPNLGEHHFVAKGEVIVFDGFLKVYLEGTDEEEIEEKNALPALEAGEALSPDSINATQRFSKHPPRFTEASLVKKLEELGIGRPSTYAPTISTIVNRGYVEKPVREGVMREYHFLSLTGGEILEETKTERTGAEKGKLFPTDIGMVVNDFLVEHFNRVLDYNFTAQVESEFDEIAEGQVAWNAMIESFYKDFHPNIQEVTENADRASGERLLGVDPKSGKNVYTRIGRFGPLVQIGEADDEEKPAFAGLMEGQQIGTITLEEALELFKFPRVLGDYEDSEVKIGIGRFGPYVLHAKKFTSIKKEDDPATINLTRAIELIEAKREADKNKFIATFDSEDPIIEVLNGRFGPYIKQGRNNYKIPKDVDPKSLSLEDCKKIIAEGGKSKGKRKTTRKATPKKKSTRKTSK
ncbi:MAG: type I DNA topoisomerase [Schleiferiaceae bacterium]